MSAQLTCQRCGFENEYNRLHCAKCGERLSFKKIEKRHLKAGSSHQKWSMLKRIVRFFLFIGLMAILLLMLWPIQPTGQIGAEADAMQYSARMFQLEEALKVHQEAAQIFQESEINAYLFKLIEHNRAMSSQKAYRMRLTGMNLRIRTRDMLLVVTMRQGPVYFSYAFSVTPYVRDGKAVLRLDRLEWGHLPIPRFAQDWFVTRIDRLFAGMKSERAVLEQASALDVKEGYLRVVLPGGE